MTIERDELGFGAPAPLGHPARLGLPDGHDVGPQLGEKLPDFRLPDQKGRTVHYAEASAGAMPPTMARCCS